MVSAALIMRQMFEVRKICWTPKGGKPMASFILIFYLLQCLHHLLLPLLLLLQCLHHLLLPLFHLVQLIPSRSSISSNASITSSPPSSPPSPPPPPSPPSPPSPPPTPPPPPPPPSHSFLIFLLKRKEFHERLRYKAPFLGYVALRFVLVAISVGKK